MKISDISLKTRLLFGNFLMAFVPVFLLAAMGWIIFLGAQFIDTGQRGALLSQLLPERGSELSIQFAVSSIKIAAERGDHLKLKKIRKACEIFEAQGMSVLILQSGKIFYLTPDADAELIIKKISAREKVGSSMLFWDNRGFEFLCTSRKHDAIIMAVGDVPFEKTLTESPFTTKKIIEVAGFFLLTGAILFIIMLSRYLSKLLSRQILEPLEKMREVSAKIREGNLDVALKVEAQDELGETCRDFERMRRELQANKILRERYEQRRKELIAGISHDLATPLTALKGYAGGILDGVAKTPAKKFHYVEMINRTVDDMEKLVESLLLFSKLDLGRVEFHLEPVCLSDYFADLVADKKEFFEQRGLILRLAENKKVAPVQIDRLQFKRLVDNLLENAIKYKRIEKVHVLIDFAAEEKFLRVNFSDDGRGVQRDELPKIFDIFYRTDPARSSSSKGSGLGLAVVKQIVEGMSGEVWAEETLGGGLTIVIRLPIFEEKSNEEKNFTD